jgi:hypothetical protein
VPQTEEEPLRRGKINWDTSASGWRASLMPKSKRPSAGFVCERVLDGLLQRHRSAPNPGSLIAASAFSSQKPMSISPYILAAVARCSAAFARPPP